MYDILEFQQHWLRWCLEKYRLLNIAYVPDGNLPRAAHDENHQGVLAN